jgi:hypothetical protein
LPQNTGATISKAMLRFTYTSTSSQFDDPSAPTTISVKDSRYIGFDDPALCTISLAVRSSNTVVNCDVTSTVQGWFTSSVPTGQRGFRIGSDTYGDQDVNIPANEGSASTAPRLVIDYTGRCANNTCPTL